MGILALPGELATFFMRLIGLQLLMLYGFARKFWDYTLKPLLQPLADMASAIPPEELNLAGILEQFVKLCLMWVMLCVSVLVAVWEILTRPFSGVLEAIRKFFWQLDYEMKAKDKSSQDREAWLEEQLKQEREQKAAAEAPKQEGNDGN